MAGQHVLRHRSGTAIGNERKIEPGHVVEQLGGQMHGGSVAAVADRQTVGRGPGEGDHVGDRVPGKRQRRRQDERRLRQPADRRKIGEGIVRQLLVEADIDRERAGGAQPDDIAVGRRLGDRIDPDGAAGARPVVDHDRLAETLLEMRLQGARQDVGAAAGREGHDQADRLGGIRLGRRRNTREGGEAGRQRDGDPRLLHGVPPRQHSRGHHDVSRSGAAQASATNGKSATRP